MSIKAPKDTLLGPPCYGSDELAAYVQKSADPLLARELEAHLRVCKRCRLEVVRIEELEKERDTPLSVEDEALVDLVGERVRRRLFGGQSGGESLVNRPAKEAGNSVAFSFTLSGPKELIDRETQLLAKLIRKGTGLSVRSYAAAAGASGAAVTVVALIGDRVRKDEVVGTVLAYVNRRALDPRRQRDVRLSLDYAIGVDGEIHRRAVVPSVDELTMETISREITEF